MQYIHYTAIELRGCFDHSRAIRRSGEVAEPLTDTVGQHVEQCPKRRGLPKRTGSRAVEGVEKRREKVQHLQ